MHHLKPNMQASSTGSGEDGFPFRPQEEAIFTTRHPFLALLLLHCYCSFITELRNAIHKWPSALSQAAREGRNEAKCVGVDKPAWRLVLVSGRLFIASIVAGSLALCIVKLLGRLLGPGTADEAPGYDGCGRQTSIWRQRMKHQPPKLNQG